MPQLKKLFPENIDTYYEPFCGGGSSFLNTAAKNYKLNDIDEYVIKLHQYIRSYCKNPEELFQILYKTIDHYHLSCSYRGITVPESLKKEYVKTYYSRYNKEAYTKLKNAFNNNKSDLSKLYLLLIYGFNHMIRFNQSGTFNLPVGNVDFNKNVYHALVGYLNFMLKNKVSFYHLDYKIFMEYQEFQNQDFVFLIRLT